MKSETKGFAYRIRTEKLLKMVLTPLENYAIMGLPRGMGGESTVDSIKPKDSESFRKERKMLDTRRIAIFKETARLLGYDPSLKDIEQYLGWTGGRSTTCNLSDTFIGKQSVSCFAGCGQTKLPGCLDFESTLRLPQQDREKADASLTAAKVRIEARRKQR